MKNQRARTLSPIAAALFLSTLLGTAISPAQEARRPDRDLVSIEFSGGTLEAFVAELKGAGEDINILIPPEADKVQVPGMSLKNVSVRAALEAVAEITMSEDVNVGISSPGGPGQPIFAVRIRLRETDIAEPGSPTQDVRVLSIRSLTESLPGDPDAAKITVSAETIINAINTGMDVLGGPEATIRYHEDSGLLFVKGTWTQINVTERIIGNMSGDLEQRRNSARRGGGGARNNGGGR